MSTTEDRRANARPIPVEDAQRLLPRAVEAVAGTARAVYIGDDPEHGSHVAVLIGRQEHDRLLDRDAKASELEARAANDALSARVASADDGSSRSIPVADDEAVDALFARGVSAGERQAQQAKQAQQAQESRRGETSRS